MNDLTINDSPSAVRIVDVSLLEMEDGQNPILDIKLRNAGDEVAFIKNINFQTLQHWDIYTDHLPSLKSVSATYDVSISEISMSIVRFSISHEIRPQETDRIQVRLSTEYSGDPNGLSIFFLDADITYNENNSRVNIARFLLNILPPEEVQGSYFPGYSKGTIKRNKAVARAVFNLPLTEIIVQAGILDSLDSWIKAPDES